MSVKKLVIFGANGMLGNYIYKYIQQQKNIQIIPLTRNDYDAYNDKLDKLENIFKKYNINSDTLVFNAVGAIPHRGINNSSYYYKVNSVFPILLSYFCDLYNCKLIHPTTDCVFSGKDGNYTENNIHDVTDDYGLSKSIGEKINGCIIRTSIIGENKNGISLVEWVKSNKNGIVSGYTNHIWNGITCLQYAKIILHMISNNIYWNGTRHIYSPNQVSKSQLIDMINKQYNLNITINETTSNDCNRSLSSNYSNLFDIPKLEEQIKEMYDFEINKM